MGNYLPKNMITPNLLDVPKDSPSRKERLEAFKAKHGVWTHNSHLPPEGEPWSALLVPKARLAMDEPTAEPMKLIAGYCSLLDEMDLLVTGKTQREAIQTLCEKNGIAFDL